MKRNGFSEGKGKSGLSQAEFARQCGVSRAAISKAIKRGRIVASADGVDVAHAGNRRWAAENWVRGLAVEAGAALADGRTRTFRSAAGWLTCVPAPALEDDDQGETKEAAGN